MELRAAFDEQALLEEARQKTGLSDFGDESFREPMRHLLQALVEEADLNDVGVAIQRQRILNILIDRLRAAEYFRKYPEILEEEIPEPLFILGLPRTGTTMLHRTIAADPRVYAANWYEVRFPVPVVDDPGAEDPRIPAAKAEVQAMLEASPELAAIHPMDAMAPDEDIMLLEHSFFSTMPESAVNVPRFAAWLAEQDQTPGYRYLKRMLQFLQWQKKRAGHPAERWVLKAPHHLGFVDLILKVFPDARFVQTHRDPVQTLASYASMIYTLWAMASDHVDPNVPGRHWSDLLARALRRCTAVRDQHPERFIDVWYMDAVKDPLGQARRIYAFAGFPMTPEAEVAITRFVQSNPREKRPPHHYTLAQFGLTEEGIRRDFADYMERFITPRTNA